MNTYFITCLVLASTHDVVNAQRLKTSIMDQKCLNLRTEFVRVLVVPNSWNGLKERILKMGLLDIDDKRCCLYVRKDCGMTGMDDSWRVVGGHPTKPKEHPWVVALVTKKNNKLFCGGSLISDIYVLTAAHCVRRMKAGDLQVVLSEGDHVDMKPGMSERREVTQIKTHEEFHQTRAFNNDIALLRLGKPVLQTPDRPPVCLPKADDSFAGEMARVVGWGLTAENGTRSSWLLQAEVPILNQRSCKELNGFMTITDGMLCASPLDGGVDACQGDSGGPLLIKEDNDRVAIAGIVSWGIGCARPNKPGIYTRVNHYLEWIIRNTKDGCFCY